MPVTLRAAPRNVSWRSNARAADASYGVRFGVLSYGGGIAYMALTGLITADAGQRVRRRLGAIGTAYLEFAHQEPGLFATAFQMNGNKDGESLAGGSKKPECIVTGGAATIAVAYQGKTYFVCCSGCKDAFNENPEKFVKAAKK